MLLSIGFVFFFFFLYFNLFFCSFFVTCLNKNCPNPWVFVGVDSFLTFELRMISFDIGFSTHRLRNMSYLCMVGLFKTNMLQILML
jgi:hypothetical protein